MKKILSNVIALVGLILVFTLYMLHKDEGFGYWQFLTHPMVLNITLAIIGISVGAIFKDYTHILLVATLVLGIYVSIFAFDSKNSEMNHFFLAIYTIFIAFSLFGNTCKLFKDWLLINQ